MCKNNRSEYLQWPLQKIRILPLETKFNLGNVDNQ